MRTLSPNSRYMSHRNIEAILTPPSPHMVGDGFRVHNFIPSGYRGNPDRMSPFLMLDYNSRYYFPPTDKPRGVGVHPHRGFETVTLAYHGKVAHHDSAGNSGVVSEGGVQWMTASSGVLHKEYHEENFSRSGGDFQMVQLWVNLPARDKMSPPKYQALERSDLPTVELPDNGGVVEIVAGEYRGVKGAASTFTPVHLFNARFRKGGKASFEFPAHYNTAVLVIEGSVRINGRDTAPVNHFALFMNDAESFSLEAEEDSVVLVLSGEPINEPVVSYGPFVMNTREEIMQAIEDVNTGKFGYLEE